MANNFPLIPSQLNVYEEFVRFHTTTFPLAASTSVSIGTAFRTIPFGQEYTTVFVDSFSMTVYVVCFAGDSIVQTVDGPVRAEDVKIGDMLPTVNGTTVPVRRVIRSPQIKQIYRIPKGTLGEDLPSQDFEITGGHHILYKGVPTKVRDVPETIKIMRETPIDVYTYTTDGGDYVIVNNVPTKTHSESEWL